jgi:hypothetical protein
MRGQIMAKASRQLAVGFAAFSLTISVQTLVAVASTYTYAFHGGALSCSNERACQSEADRGIRDYVIDGTSYLQPLEAILVIDESALPSKTLENATLRWGSDAAYSEITGRWDLYYYPNWLVSFETNYVDNADELARGIFLQTDSNRRVTNFSAYLWTVGGSPFDYQLYFSSGLARAYICALCEDRRERYTYDGWFAPVPLPPALLPFLAGLTLVGGGTALRNLRPMRSSG